MISKIKVIAAAAAVLCCAGLSGCADKVGSNDSVSETVSVSGTSKEIDVSKLFEETPAPETDSSDSLNEEDFNQTFATVTDVENELDRAIYKAKIVLPDGWQLLDSSKEGLFYSCPLGTCMIKAQNFGADAELTDLDVFADSVAGSITMNNMFYQADTEFSEPKKLSVGGQDAVGYDYTVTAYIYKYTDEEIEQAKAAEESGNKADIPEGTKEVFGVFKDEIYILYYGTDAYILLFEAPEGNYESVKDQFAEIRDSFYVSDDGTEGYEVASSYQSSKVEVFRESLKEDGIEGLTDDEIIAMMEQPQQ